MLVKYSRKSTIDLIVKITIVLLFATNICFSQAVKTIDTINHDFRKATEVFYLTKVTASEKSYDQIDDRKIRKYILESHKDFKESFLVKIKKGRFVNDNRYENLATELFSKIQKANPEIADVKILFSLGTSANAYNFGEDIVVVYLKLLQELENKNQLGFILCHEIGHQMLQHSKKSILKFATQSFSESVKATTKAISKARYNKGELAREASKKILYGNAAQRRKAEIEADSIGLLFYKKAFPDAKKEALTTMELLDKMDLQKDSLTPKDFENFFGSAKQPFKQHWILNDELKNYQYQKGSKFFEIDSLKSHPDCADRIKILKKFDGSLETSIATNKTVDFDDFKNQTKYDVLFGLHFIKNYGDSLYETLLMLKKNPGDAFLKNMVYENLVKIQEAQKTYTLAKHLETADPQNYNDYNMFLYFIRQLRKTELENIIEIYKP